MQNIATVLIKLTSSILNITETITICISHMWVNERSMDLAVKYDATSVYIESMPSPGVWQCHISTI